MTHIPENTYFLFKSHYDTKFPHKSHTVTIYSEVKLDMTYVQDVSIPVNVQEDTTEEYFKMLITVRFLLDGILKNNIKHFVSYFTE